MAKYRYLVVIAVAALIVGIALTGPVFGAGTANNATQKIGNVESVEGIIAIKEGHGDILVRPDNGGDKRLRVRDSSTIIRNGASATYEELQSRDQVQVKYDSASRNVIEIRASGS
jgi:hypothetical protein